ncbi:uncharacterized protein TNCV_4987361 [Trichonephila clavipes]|nr:uncharacterized protein TNCV_4987361 [Trichonephila clavipes]
MVTSPLLKFTRFVSKSLHIPSVCDFNKHSLLTIPTCLKSKTTMSKLSNSPPVSLEYDVNAQSPQPFSEREMQWNNILPYRTVARWIGKFQQGRVSTSDEQRLGRPVSVRTDLTRAIIEQLMDYIKGHALH